MPRSFGMGPFLENAGLSPAQLLVSARAVARATRPSVDRTLRRVKHLGTARFCPVCRSTVRAFDAAGERPRADASCPVCYSRERHRLMWLFFLQRTDLFDGRAKSMLHVAPEACFEPRLRRALGVRYLTIDLEPGRADFALDLTRLSLPSQAFDVVYCSHVLEHVPDDGAAMRELRRVLRPSGWAVIDVPVTRSALTFEDFSVTDPDERARLFGQADHVRNYGRDFADRLRAARFHVRVDRFFDGLDESTRRRCALLDQDIYYCTLSSEAAP